MSIVSDLKPLESGHLPDKLLNRASESERIQTGVEGSQNLHVHGPLGSGKTAFVKQAVQNSTLNSCYISCIRYDTQYTALKQILSDLSNESVETGHHTSELQRRLQKQIDGVETTVILDDFDFLLLNDSDDLLYFLSQLDPDLALVLVTANHADLSEHVEERTYSRLQTLSRIKIEPYTEEEAYEVLADRARKSLKPRSLHREALSYIASSTQNLEAGLTWLRHAAHTAENAITKELVEDIEQNAKQRYIDDRLKQLSRHHGLIYKTIEGLSTERGSSVRSGEIYGGYNDLCNVHNIDPLSSRRISDHLKQLEQLQLITANYHYGGQRGKTREIRKYDIFN